MRLGGITVTKQATNVLILVLLIVTFAVLSDSFLDPVNVRNVLRQISVVALVAAAFTLVMVAGGLDLSVGGVVALSGVAAALLAAGGAPLPVAWLVGLAVGAVVGLVNALLIVGLRINPVIATLGSLYVSRGVANLLTDGKPVHGVPADYGSLGTGFVGLVPRPVLIMLVVVVTLSVLQSRTVLGRYAAAIGSSTEAATLAGIRVERVRMLLYVLTGAAAGLGGIIVSSRLNSGQPTAATGFEFDVIVACILGGTTLRGGEGTIGGSVVGALIVGVLNNGLNLLGVQTFWQTIVQGTILVLAVALDLFIRERRTGPGRQRRPHGEQSRAHTATDRGDPDDPPGSVPTHRRPDRVG